MIEEKISNGMNLENKIEAILFMKGEPQRIKSLASLLKVGESEVSEAVSKLAESLNSLGRGIRLMKKDDFVMLATSPEVASVVREMAKEEYDSKLSLAAIETLAIVAYKGPIIKAEIDYVRGVNSGFILRNLLIRGLVERIANPSDRRAFMYRPSFELLQFLGIEKVEDLPEYKDFNEKMEESISEIGEEEKKVNETFKELEEDLAKNSGGSVETSEPNQTEEDININSLNTDETETNL